MMMKPDKVPVSYKYKVFVLRYQQSIPPLARNEEKSQKGKLWFSTVNSISICMYSISYPYDLLCSNYWFLISIWNWITRFPISSVENAPSSIQHKLIIWWTQRNEMLFTKTVRNFAFKHCLTTRHSCRVEWWDTAAHTGPEANAEKIDSIAHRDIYNEQWTLKRGQTENLSNTI